MCSNWVCVVLMQAEQQLDCALDLMRRLPPQQIEKNLSDLIDLVIKYISVAMPMFNGAENLCHMYCLWGGML